VTHGDFACQKSAPCNPPLNEVHPDRCGYRARDCCGVSTLHVVPSGAMLGLPVETLRSRDGGLLDERFVVSYIPSASLFAWLH